MGAELSVFYFILFFHLTKGQGKMNDGAVILKCLSLRMKSISY